MKINELCLIETEGYFEMRYKTIYGLPKVCFANSKIDKNCEMGYYHIMR